MSILNDIEKATERILRTPSDPYAWATLLTKGDVYFAAVGLTDRTIVYTFLKVPAKEHNHCQEITTMIGNQEFRYDGVVDADAVRFYEAFLPLPKKAVHGDE